MQGAFFAAAWSDFLAVFNVTTWWFFAPPAAIAGAQQCYHYMRSQRSMVGAIIAGVLMYPMWVVAWFCSVGAPIFGVVWLVARIALPASAEELAEPRTFGGYDCSDDCSGHAAGYRWAAKNPHRLAECQKNRSQSFREGCWAYEEDPTRGADLDDEGEPVED